MRERHTAIDLVLLSNQVSNAIRVAQAPAFVDDGAIDYLCAACGAPLCVGMHDGELAGLALRCGCGWSSRVPAAAHAEAS